MAERFVIPDDLARAAADEGRGGWLDELPALVARIAAGWQIEVCDAFLPGGATAWVAPARDDAGNDLLLKVCWPHPEAVHEAGGLRTWGGGGAVRVYRAGELAEATVLLLERCRPGTQLRALPPEEHDLVIAGLLRRLWVKPPPGHCFRPLADMCDYWASRYENRSLSERSCLEAPLAKEASACSVSARASMLASSPPGWRACLTSISAGSCPGSLPGPSKHRRTGPG